MYPSALARGEPGLARTLSGGERQKARQAWAQARHEQAALEAMSAELCQTRQSIAALQRTLSQPKTQRHPAPGSHHPRRPPSPDPDGKLVRGYSETTGLAPLMPQRSLTEPEPEPEPEPDPDPRPGPGPAPGPAPASPPPEHAPGHGHEHELGPEPELFQARHPSHHHPLSLVASLKGACDVCGRSVAAGQSVLECARCNWYACDRCMGPAAARRAAGVGQPPPSRPMRTGRKLTRSKWHRGVRVMPV